MQGELLDLICRATEAEIDELESSESQSSSCGWLSIEEVAAELNLSQRKAGKGVPLAVDLVRQDRNAR
ncbi:MAG: hypothetical protein NXH95_13035 [Pseudomonadaceae bacterium]|nr:hypothetical protein [Pseudomonadaceae bacterium]